MSAGLVFEMISLPPSFTPRAQGLNLDTRPESFGLLECSSELLGNQHALQKRMQEHGYLFLKGFFNREDVLAARRTIVERMATAGLLDPGTDPMLAILRQGAKSGLSPEFTADNAELKKILYTGELMNFYRVLFGEEVRHFDFTWLRTVGPGAGTNPHCDVVYMGRGTRDRLYTAWVPLGDVPIELGGLMILEGSHRQKARLSPYLNRDVDQYCSNGRHAEAIETGKKLWEWAGFLSNNPVSLRENLADAG